MVVWGGNHRLLPLHSGADSSLEHLGTSVEAPREPRRAARKARRSMAASLIRERRRVSSFITARLNFLLLLKKLPRFLQAQLIQCRDGTQDQRNINAILELAAGVDNEAAKKVGEVAKEGEEGPSPKKRKREVKNAVRGSGQYVYDEDGVRLVSQTNPFNLTSESSQIPGLCCQCFSCWPFTSETSSGICSSFLLCIRVCDS